MSFFIAAFHKNSTESEIAIAHKNWLIGADKCYWPSFWRTPALLYNAVTAGVAPDHSSWRIYDVHVIRNRFYETYEQARKDLPRAEEGSDWSSEIDDQVETHARQKRKSTTQSNFSGLCEDRTRSNDQDYYQRPVKKKAPVSLPPPPSGADIFGERSFSQGPLIKPSSLVGVSYTGNSQPSFQLISHTENTVGSFTRTADVVPVLQSMNEKDTVANSNNEEDRTLTNLGNGTCTSGNMERAQSYSFLNTEDFPYQISSEMTKRSTNTQEYYNNGLSTPVNASSLTTMDRPINLRGLATSIQQLQTSQTLIESKVDMLLDMVRALVKNNGHYNRDLNSGDTGFSINLPLTSVDKLRNLEEKVSQNSDIRDALIIQLKCKGGEYHTQITYRIMTALMTDELMMEFTFCGQTGKHAFKSSILLHCVFSAVRGNVKGSVATDKEIEKAVDYWLKKASFRIQKRNVKERKRLERESSLDQGEEI